MIQITRKVPALFQWSEMQSSCSDRCVCQPLPTPAALPFLGPGKAPCRTIDDKRNLISKRDCFSSLRMSSIWAIVLGKWTLLQEPPEVHQSPGARTPNPLSTPPVGPQPSAWWGVLNGVPPQRRAKHLTHALCQFLITHTVTAWCG